MRGSCEGGEKGAGNTLADGWQPVVCTLGAVWRVVTAVRLAGLLSPTVNDSIPVLLALQGAAWLLAGRQIRWAESASRSLIFAVVPLRLRRGRQRIPHWRDPSLRRDHARHRQSRGATPPRMVPGH
ncbi:MAG: hypothetical protein ACKV19_05320 [Verrucomicrobiales bacterium]